MKTPTLIAVLGSAVLLTSTAAFAEDFLKADHKMLRAAPVSAYQPYHAAPAHPRPATEAMVQGSYSYRSFSYDPATANPAPRTYAPQPYVAHREPASTVHHQFWADRKIRGLY